MSDKLLRVFATGEGITTPSGVDGAVSGQSSRVPVLAVTTADLIRSGKQSRCRLRRRYS